MTPNPGSPTRYNRAFSGWSCFGTLGGWSLRRPTSAPPEHDRSQQQLDARYKKQRDIIEPLIRGLMGDDTRALATRILVQDVGSNALPHLRRIAHQDSQPSARARALALYERMRAERARQRSRAAERG